MKTSQDLIQSIFEPMSPEVFNETAIKIFLYQYENNQIYHKYVDYLAIQPNKIIHYSEIPFLPISFFKTHKIISGENNPVKTFKSSGTTGQEQSCHYITDLNLYDKSLLNGFNYFYGDITEYCIIAVLPSYHKDSSLIYMSSKLIEMTGRKESGFYNDYDEVIKLLSELNEKKIKTILIGVSYALLEMAEKYSCSLYDTIIMETGGMKGRKKEMIREELHSVLKKSFKINSIHSEYGMTELLSQAYSFSNGIFRCPPWMKVLIREMNDPLSIIGTNKSGGINVIDFANINSCSFIATDDTGFLNEDSSFEVTGRIDFSDIRGCNLLFTNK